MIVDRIKFSKEFFILGAGEWVTMEAQLRENEDPCECIKELKQKMISMYGGGYKSGKEQQVDEFVNDWKEKNGWVMSQDSYSPPKTNIADDIESCKDITVLESYKILVKTNPDLR